MLAPRRTLETYYLQVTMGTKAVMCDVITDGHTPLSFAVSTQPLASCWCRCWRQGTCGCWWQGTGALFRAGTLLCAQCKVKHQRMSEGKTTTTAGCSLHSLFTNMGSDREHAVPWARRFRIPNDRVSVIFTGHFQKSTNKLKLTLAIHSTE